MRILVLGGYGNFGARICRALAGNAGIEVIAAGRNPASAPPGFAQRGIQTIALDTAAPDFSEALRRVGCGAVIHCVGPFQGQGYHVVHAALACGAHYIDLADGREFVVQFSATADAAARQAGKLAVSGASTLPALSAAVVDALAARFSALHSIHTVIAPAQRAPRGAATLAGVMSYAGRPFTCLAEGTWRMAFGWMHLRPVSLGPLGTRLSAVCDVPDLDLFAQRYVGVATVAFRAALEIGVQHRAIALLAWLRRAGLPLPIERLAGAMEALAQGFDRFGSETGGMEVRVAGLDPACKPLTLAWRIVAPGNHGPEIPCMAAILLARRLAAGTEGRRGAQPCVGLLTLEDFAPEFARWGMTTSIEELP
jgi:uncharacterized protein YbjT (DUF2867 family)